MSLTLFKITFLFWSNISNNAFVLFNKLSPVSFAVCRSIRYSLRVTVVLFRENYRFYPHEILENVNVSIDFADSLVRGPALHFGLQNFVRPHRLVVPSVYVVFQHGDPHAFVVQQARRFQFRNQSRQTVTNAERGMI